ncbi:hypothetical protein [Bacillus sp. BB56-3]|uniref:hypothetical protein n=1 Tax=Bacillus sp. BB56-3 TaxID=2217831 RepID=UPI0011ECBB79|nr:hypothetical protein [Bacillus sp. BB56-3]KAA0784303.1 hypothetical protein DN406_27200 [Bacillus sp. BB56-3]
MNNKIVDSDSNKEVSSDVRALIYFDNGLELGINGESASCLEDMNYPMDDFVDVVDMNGVTCSINTDKIVLIKWY